MKLTKFLLVAGAVLPLAVCSVDAQTSTTQPIRTGKVVVPERPTATDANISGAANVRPPRPERPDLPPAVKARIDRFKLDARAYLAQQEALKKQLQGASEDERAALREQLQVLRQQWLEKAQELRKEAKDRAAQLEQKLRDHKEILDEIRNGARDQRPSGPAGGGDSPRRGTD